MRAVEPGQQPAIKKNILYNTFYQILTIITPLITAPYVSRVLGADGVGIQSYTGSIQAYFTLLAALGTASYGSREISRHRGDKSGYSQLFWEIELLTVGTAGVSILGWSILCLCSSRYRLYFLALMPNLLSVMLDISWLFAGLEQFKLTVVRNSFFRILGIVLLFMFVKTSDDLLLYLWILSITGVLSSVSLWFYLPRIVVRPDWRELKIIPHFRQTLIYFVPTIATSIYTVLDKTLIGLITDNTAQNGYYAQAEKIVNIAKSISFVAVNSVVGVRIAYLFAENRLDEVRNRIKNSIHYILFMGFGCMFGIIGIADEFVPVFFGDGYGPVTVILRIFSPIIVVIGISNCLGSHYYTPIGKRAQSSGYLIAGALVNLVLNCCFIPVWGAVGAAIASVTAEMVITVLYLRNCEGYLTLSILIKAGWKKMVAGMLMALGLILLGRSGMEGYLLIGCQMIAGVCGYGAFLLLLRDQWVGDRCRMVLCKLKSRLSGGKDESENG